MKSKYPIKSLINLYIGLAYLCPYSMSILMQMQPKVGIISREIQISLQQSKVQMKALEEILISYRNPIWSPSLKQLTSVVPSPPPPHNLSQIARLCLPQLKKQRLRKQEFRRLRQAYFTG